MQTKIYDYPSHGSRVKLQIKILEVHHPKHIDANPVARLIVERQEKYEYNERDGSVWKASIELSYRLIHSDTGSRHFPKNEFCGSYSAHHNFVSLISSSATSKSALFLNLPGLEGHRIGTYLMNEIVLWTNQFPNTEVRPVTLAAGQGTSENKERRNLFYERFGLVFDYTDTESKAGFSRPMLTNDLNQVNSWKKNIHEHTLYDYLGKIVRSEEEKILELEMKAQTIKRLVEESEAAYRYPLRWMMKVLYDKYDGYIIGAVIVVILLLLTWKKVTS